MANSSRIEARVVWCSACRGRVSGLVSPQRDFVAKASGTTRSWSRSTLITEPECGLTGRSTGGATAGRLSRVALCAYPPPRGQGGLPRLPGYLYVRPRRRHGAQAQRTNCALRACPSFRPRTERSALRSRAAVQVRFRRFAPGKASVLRRCAQGSVVVGASHQRAAPRNQFVGAPRSDGSVCFAVALHAARGAALAQLSTTVPAQLCARPNRSFNRRCHGRPPCPRGSVCISSATRARQPAASPRLPLR